MDVAEGTALAMEERDWNSLAYSIAHGYCHLMLGPDVFTERVNGQRSPVLNRLSRELMKLTDDPGLFEDGDYRGVAQAVMANDLLAVQATAVNTLANVTLDAPALSDLAALPFRLVINTAPGIEVEKVWRVTKPDTHSAYYDYRPRRALLPVPEPSPQAPLVYHLYGSLENPPSLTLGESDLIELLVAIVGENPDLPTNLKSMLRNRQHTFLFLGFRLQLWHLRVLLHVLAANDPQSQSYALQAVESLDAGTRQFYRQGHKIKFCDFEVESFVAELLRRVAAITPLASDVAVAADVPVGPDTAVGRSGPGARPSPVQGSATVFICHASEDKAFAESLRTDLEAAGFDTWLDKDDLRGGDLWDTEIERALGSVRYVVVLQSEHLASKQEGYVNKEINLALQRQLTFRSDLRFIVPAVIDSEDNLLEGLKHIQSIKLYEPDGFQRLRQALARDQERATKK